ncbi:DEAD/DEAH box helicase [Salsuginibacillus kocurii]|uniref:DEAD/DEAH box helicase n=1 Tax=Salsuginibacillus kocurii TaxID=427078 RepID=UPI000A056C69|nr:DEAD/DEAH box helicase [Salsuginibacillus kocurii]
MHLPDPNPLHTATQQLSFYIWTRLPSAALAQPPAARARLHGTSRHLSGRRLPTREVPGTASDLALLDVLRLLKREPALSPLHRFPRRTAWRCTRCGNTSAAGFTQLPDGRTYCRLCIDMGRMTEGDILYSWRGPAPSARPARLAWEGTLTPAQQQGAAALEAAVGRGEEHLIWAVCGAGKTEMLFPALLKSLARGERAVIATPRADVVLELLPRLKQAFPETEITGLYGGSSDRDRYGQLVIATTHQLRRYARAFDLVIIDEIDAFPYTFDETLQYAVSQAARPTATTIYLTATPTNALKTRLRRRTLPYTLIPRRYHGFDLPRPRLQWIGNWQKQMEKGRVPPALRSWLESHEKAGRSVFLFVPSISSAAQLTELTGAPAVHASDPERRERVAAFRAGHIPVLITTTILERGVTIANAQVAVIGADDDIFTASALTQIAGRAGRSASAPAADVTFFHHGKTDAIVACRRYIDAMNHGRAPL